MSAPARLPAGEAPASLPSGPGARAVDRLRRVCARRAGVVVAAWVVIATGLVGLVLAAGRPVDTDVALPGSDAQIARDLLDAHPAGTGPAAASSGQVLLRVREGRLDDPSRAAGLAAAVSAVEDVDRVRQARPPSAVAGTLSADGTVGWVAVDLDVPPRDVSGPLARTVVDAVRAPLGDDVEVVPGGTLAAAADRGGGHRQEAVGVLVAVVVLLVTFRRWPAALLPVGTALTTVAVGLSLVGLAGHLVSVPAVASTLTSMVGLGVGIDYALFVLTRFRRSRGAGADIDEAVATSLVSSGTAVVSAGGTVVVALGGLAVAGVPVLATLAWATGLAVVVAVAGTLTLVPAALTLLGPWLGASIDRPHDGWGRWADRVTGRPRAWLASVVVVLALLAWPATGLVLGQVTGADHPVGTAQRTASDLLSGSFGAGAEAPLTVAASVTGERPGGAAGAAAEVTSAIAGVPGVASVGPATPSADGVLLRVQVTPVAAASDPAVDELLAALRALDVDGVEVHVGGATATRADLAERVGERMPLVVGTVLLLSTVVLLLAFRAPVVAVKAALANLVSLGAAYGVLTWVFQEGHGAGALGLDGPVPVESYVPMMLFALLFGLSMDYEVFLLTAVREAWDAGAGSRGSVRDGLARTGRVVTAAALVMVSVFLAFVGDHDPVVKMFGVGMAVAVTVDATLVRGVLVPATMVLLGRANWWTVPARWPGPTRSDTAGRP